MSAKYLALSPFQALAETPDGGVVVLQTFEQRPLLRDVAKLVIEHCTLHPQPSTLSSEPLNPAPQSLRAACLADR